MSADLGLRLAGAAGLAVAVLSACGGGSATVRAGGAVGTATPAPVTAPTAQPTLAGSVGTPIPLAGNAVSITTTGGTTSVAPQAGVASARTIDSASQATLTFAINNTVRSAPVDLTTPSASASNGVGVPVFEARLSDGVLSTADTNAGTLAYMSFGYWIFQPTDTRGTPTGAATLQAYFGGRETPVGNLPTAGSATYTGRTLGFGTSAGASFFLAGNVSLTANFATTGLNARTISGDISGITTSPSQTLMPAGAVTPSSIVLGGGSISSNRFDGTATAFSGAANIGSGTFSGKFFGPAAQEVGGQWSFQSPAGSPAVSAVGSFGAKTP